MAGHSSHPGIIVYTRKRAGAEPKLYCRYVDPDTDEEVTSSLTALGYATKTEAGPWLEEKAQKLKRRRDEISSGKRRAIKSNAALQELIDAYASELEAERGHEIGEEYKKHRLKPFVDWYEELFCKQRHLVDLIYHELQGFRTWLLRQRRKHTAKGGGIKITPVKLKASTINTHLSVASALLNWGRRHGYVRLSSDDIGEALRKVPMRRDTPRFFSANELCAIVQTSWDLDQTSCHCTRPKRGESKSPLGVLPPKYEPIFPFVLLLMLTGMRLSEALYLKWTDVDFDRRRIFIRHDEASGHEVKTRKARHIPLDDSPVLETYLKKLREASPNAKYVLGRGHDPKNHDKRSWRRLRNQVAFVMRPKDFRSNFTTYALCAEGLYAGRPHLLAKRNGHGLQVMMDHYAGLIDGLPASTTVEGVMGVEDVLWKIVSPEKEPPAVHTDAQPKLTLLKGLRPQAPRESAP